MKAKFAYVKQTLVNSSAEKIESPTKQKTIKCKCGREYFVSPDVENDVRLGLMRGAWICSSCGNEINLEFLQTQLSKEVNNE